MNIFEIKNYRFALKKTINQLIDESQNNIIDELKDKFQIRKNWFQPSGKFGVRVRYATKDNLTAQVFTNAPWLPPHQVGGSVRPANSKNIAIPTIEHWNRGTILRKSQRIAQMNKKTFFIKNDSGDTLFLKRVGSRSVKKKKTRSPRGARREPKSKLKVLFILKKSVDLKKRLSFIETVNNLFERRLSVQFHQNLSSATQDRK